MSSNSSTRPAAPAHAEVDPEGPCGGEKTLEKTMKKALVTRTLLGGGRSKQVGSHATWSKHAFIGWRPVFLLFTPNFLDTCHEMLTCSGTCTCECNGWEHQYVVWQGLDVQTKCRLLQYKQFFDALCSSMFF